MTKLFFNTSLNELFTDKLIDFYSNCPLFAWITGRKDNYQCLVELGLLDNIPYGTRDVSINGFYLLSRIVRNYFRMTNTISNKVNRNLDSNWNTTNRIGIHIRKGDKTSDLRESHPFLYNSDVNSFIECNIIKNYINPTIYLASDSTVAKLQFQSLNKKYNYHIMTTNIKARHTSVFSLSKGPSSILFNTVADLLSIAQSDIVIGTQDSTFSIVAAAFQGKVPYLVAKHKHCYQPQILVFSSN